MQAITVRDRDAGVGGLSLKDMPYPHAAQNDVIVRVLAGGFTPGELDWPTTCTDRTGRSERLAIGPGYSDLDLVFAHVDGRPLNPATVSRALDALVKGAGVPKITLDGLRHTFATLLHGR